MLDLTKLHGRVPLRRAIVDTCIGNHDKAEGSKDSKQGLACHWSDQYQLSMCPAMPHLNAADAAGLCCQDSTDAGCLLIEPALCCHAV